MPRPDASTPTDAAPQERGALAARQREVQRLRGLIGGGLGAKANPSSTATQRPFDDLLGGVRPRRLVDLLVGSPGCGASLVGLWLAARACRRRGELVVVDGAGVFYPPAAVGWGVEAKRLLWVRPGSMRDALAATETALRSPAVGAVWAALGRIDGRAFRRLLLAAEAGEAMGVLVRPARHEPDPSWADVQLCLEGIPTPGDPDALLLVRATRRRNRHGPAGGEATLSMDWRIGGIQDVTNHYADGDPNTNALPVAAGLAGAAKSA